MGKTIHFTQEQIKDIISLYLSGETLSAVGQKYGVSYRPIKRVLEENNIQIRTAGETRRRDLVNQRFGKLTVISIDPNYTPASGRHAKWLCQCECGAIVSVQSNHLLDGSASACSPMCKHRIPENTRIGRLTVLCPTHQRDPINGAVLYECVCDCGEKLTVSSTELRAKRKSSCHKCAESYGESVIRHLLESNNIVFEQEKKFDDCINPETQSYYRFDFYVNNEYMIEYDGEQHFKPISHFGGQEYLEICQARDAAKNQYCKDRGIPVIRIPYTDIEGITLDDLILSTSKYVI